MATNGSELSGGRGLGRETEVKVKESMMERILVRSLKLGEFLIPIISILFYVLRVVVHFSVRGLCPIQGYDFG